MIKYVEQITLKERTRKDAEQSNAELLQLLSSESAEAEMNWIATI